MDIKKITKIFDDELIDKSKSYLLLGQANKLLIERGVLTVEARSNKALKKLLENNELPQAHQIGGNPKQWRIHLSDEGEQRLLKIKGQRKKTKKGKNESGQTSKEKAICPECNTESVYGIHCKNCGTYLIIPEDVIIKENIEYLIEQKNAQKDKQITTVRELKVSKSQRNWITVIVIIGILWLLGTFSSDDKTSTLYKVNTTTIVGTSKSSFDEMFAYLLVGDEKAISSLMLYGEVKTLSSGTDVYLMKAHFGYAIVRVKGSTQNLWIVTDYITKE